MLFPFFSPFFLFPSRSLPHPLFFAPPPLSRSSLSLTELPLHDYVDDVAAPTHAHRSFEPPLPYLLLCFFCIVTTTTTTQSLLLTAWIQAIGSGSSYCPQISEFRMM